jgi:hypothetical protein
MQMKKPKARWLVVRIALGLFALALLWLPLGEYQDMTFSGPTRICRNYGVLSYLTDDTHYSPRGCMGLSSGGITRQPSDVMKEGDIIWKNEGSGLFLIRVIDHTSTLNGWSLAVTGALTALVGWFSMIRPVRGYLRTRRACSAQQDGRVGNGDCIAPSPVQVGISDIDERWKGPATEPSRMQGH